jgi:hypothetical protein
MPPEKMARRPHPAPSSQARAVEVHRASSSASASYHAVWSTPSRPVASSSRSASQALSDGGPRSKSQTLTLGISRHEHCSSCFRNSATSLLTTSTRKVSLGKLTSHLGVVECSDPHPLQQVIPHPWKTYNGKAQLSTMGLYK